MRLPRLVPGSMPGRFPVFKFNLSNDINNLCRVVLIPIRRFVSALESTTWLSRVVVTRSYSITGAKVPRGDHAQHKAAGVMILNDLTEKLNHAATSLQSTT